MDSIQSIYISKGAGRASIRQESPIHENRYGIELARKAEELRRIVHGRGHIVADQAPEDLERTSNRRIRSLSQMRIGNPRKAAQGCALGHVLCRLPGIRRSAAREGEHTPHACGLA